MEDPVGDPGEPASQTHKQNGNTDRARRCSKNDSSGDFSRIGLFLPAQKFGSPLLNQVCSITQRHQMVTAQKFFF